MINKIKNHRKPSVSKKNFYGFSGPKNPLDFLVSLKVFETLRISFENSQGLRHKRCAFR